MKRSSTPSPSAAEMTVGPVAETVNDLLPLFVLGMAMVYSDRLFTFIDDEVTILGAAAQPVRTTIALFRSGIGQHEHPPLYDLWLHVWLWISGGAFAWLRVPSILFFLVGLWMLSRAARRLGGPVSGTILVWLGMLWPYGFHFGRLAGWYSFTFLLISTLTWAYLRFCDSPSPKGWTLVSLLGLALVYTNYFGWALLAALGVDNWIRNKGQERPAGRRLLGTAIFLVVFYAPLWPVFIRELSTGTHLHQSWKVLVANGGFNVYALFVSESVAPWFWRFGIPATVAVAAALLLTFAGVRGAARRLLIYGALLVICMDFAGILVTKRLLPVAPWFLLPIAVALGTMKNNAYLRRALALSLIIVAGIGWYGIYSRRFYAAPRFIEPWADLSTEAAKAVHDGAGVIGNNESFFFYLTYALRVPPNPSWRFEGVLPDAVRHPQVWSAEEWVAAGRPVRPYMLWVEGMPMGGSMDDASAWLSKACGGRVNRYLVRDPGYIWKQRFFPDLGQVPWRIETQQYSCDEGATSPAPSVVPGLPPSP